MLIHRPKIKIVATLLVKNEEDIVKHNIEHHISQGVKQFIVTDNNSSDATRKIIEQYPEVIEIIDEPGEDHNQSAWVTRMAKMATKLSPDWIIHLDADEFWCGLTQLQEITANAVGCTKMFLHPPCNCDFDIHKMRYYLDCENIPNLPGECKVAHRPNPYIMINHGNHGFNSNTDVHYTRKIWRHHYPIRSYEHFLKKTVNGHQALMKRNAPCERWKKWYDYYFENKLKELYDTICTNWIKMQENPCKENLLSILNFWSPPEVIQLFENSNILPTIGEWPKSTLNFSEVPKNNHG